MTVDFFDVKRGYKLETNRYVADTVEQLKKIDLKKEADKRKAFFKVAEIK